MTEQPKLAKGLCPQRFLVLPDYKQIPSDTEGIFEMLTSIPPYPTAILLLSPEPCFTFLSYVLSNWGLIRKSSCTDF